jgi:hypothetical protein
MKKILLLLFFATVSGFLPGQGEVKILSGSGGLLGKSGTGAGFSGKIIIPNNLKTGKPQLFRPNMMYGYVLNDSILIPFEYEELDFRYSDFMLAKRNGFWGALNKKGEAVLPFDYKILKQLKKGALLARKSTESGLLSPSNEVLVPFEYKTITQLNDSTLVFNRQYKQLVVNVLGQNEVQVISTMEYDWFEKVGDNDIQIFSARPSGGKMGIVDLNNRVLLPFEYPKIIRFSGNLIVVINENEFCGLVNFQNQLLVPMIYRSIDYTENPNVLMVYDERWKKGMIDSMGKVIIPIQYTFCGLLNNLDFVKCKTMNSHYSLWDLNGKQLTSDIYENFSGEKTHPTLIFGYLSDKKKWHILDRNGQVLNRDLVDSYTVFPFGFVCVINEKVAIFDLLGKQMTDFIYTNPQRFKSMEEAKDKAQKLGLPSETRLVCSAKKTDGQFVYIDDEGKEFLMK